MNAFGNSATRASPILAAASLLLLLLGCGKTDGLAGGATETGNTQVTGRVVDPAGGPVAGLRLQLFPEDFNPLRSEPSPSLRVTSGGDGGFAIGAVPEGVYHLQGRDAASSRGVFSRAEIKSAADTSLNLGPLRLEPLRRVVVWVDPSLLRDGAEVYLEGTDSRALPGPDGKAVLDSVAADRARAVYYDVPGDSAIIHCSERKVKDFLKIDSFCRAGGGGFRY